MIKLIPLICGFIGLLVAFANYSWIRRANKNLKGVNVPDNTYVYRRDDWTTIIATVVVLGVGIGVFVNWFACLLYVYGAGITLIVDIVGGKILDLGIHCFSYAEENTTAFRISYRTGAVAGLFMACFGLLALGAIFIPFNLTSAVTAISAYGFGVSTVVIFNRSILKPAIDIYESYIQIVVAVIILSFLAVKNSDITSTFNAGTAAIFPLIIISVGVIASIIGTLFVRGRERSQRGLHINICVIVSSIITAIASVFLSFAMLQSYAYSIAILIGIVVGILIGFTTAKNMIFTPVILFAVSIIVPGTFVGLYGIVLAALGFISVTAMLISINTFGTVTNVNSTVVKLGNGYSTCASALAVLAIFIAYIDKAELTGISIMDPTVLVGLLIGVTMPLVYVILTTRWTEKNKYSYYMDLISILITLLIGVFFGAETLGAMLGGLVCSGLVTSFIMSNFNVSDNSNMSTITVSSINTLIKYMTVVALVFAPVFTKFGGIL